MKKKCLTFLITILMSMQLHAFSTNGTQILDEGKPITLKAFNWFGFENGDTMVAGLWDSSNALAFDFATVVYRQQLLGFNTVRLPFSFTDFAIPPRTFNQSCTFATQGQIQANVTDPSVPVPPGMTIPPQVSPPTRTPGQCNSYLPNSSTLERFLWVINFFAKNGFYVLIDNHTQDRTVLNSVETWKNNWVSLYTAICQDPVSKSKVMIDLLNEPDGRGMRWEANGNIPSTTTAYLSAMDALYAVNKDALFFVEGTAQGGIGCNWGDGFCTNPTLIQQFGLSNPNPFFQALMQKPYLNQVVISPHVYPPSVTGQSANGATGAGLWNRLSQSFGYLTTTGYCSNGTCKLFPIVIGEFGSRFATAVDVQSMKDIALYLNNSGAAADGLHEAIPSWAYWDWNANSGDTGGLVDDSWVTILWNKVQYLQTLGLKPWYVNTPPVQTGNLCLTVAPATGLAANQLLPISVGGNSFSVTGFNSAVCKSIGVGSYTVTPPQITTSTMVFTAPSQNVTVTQGGTTNATITYTGKPISNEGKLCLTVTPVTGLSANQLLPISVGGVSFPLSGFNTAVCQSLTPGSYTVTPPQITTSTMVFTAPSQNVTVTQGGTASATITYTGKPISTGGKLCLTVAPNTGLTAAQLLPISVGGVSFPITAFSTAVCESLAAGTYTVTPPQITTPTMVFTAPSQNVTVTNGGMTNATITYTGTPITQGNFIVKVQLGTPWQSAPGVYSNSVNLFIQNKGTQKVNVPWTLTLGNNAYQSVPSSWNITVNSIANGTISATAALGWEALSPNSGNTVNVGMIISSSSPNFMPTTATINGIPCTITTGP